MTTRTALLSALILYGLPLWRLRYRWRATVYRMDHWRVNVMPWFGHDFLALFTNRYFENATERRMARNYRLYLLGYLGLFVWFAAAG